MKYLIKAQQENLDVLDSKIIVKERGLGKFFIDKKEREECVEFAKILAREYKIIEYNYFENHLKILIT